MKEKSTNGQLNQSSHIHQRRLQARIVTAILGASLLPLVLTIAGTWIVFGEMLDKRALALHHHIVEAHRASIDLYLEERIRVLQIASQTYSLEELTSDSGLNFLFQSLNQTYDNAFVDLGVIDERGAHLAYVGPYDLSDRSYEGAEWFRGVMFHGTHVSDVFLGFRGVPHCVIAIKHQNRDRSWILRATINSNQFDEFVRTSDVGATGDVFIVNKAGIFQTAPRRGTVLDRAPLNDVRFHQGVRQTRVDVEGDTLLRATAWLNRGQWMLVVQQNEAEIQSPLRQALTQGGLVVLIAVVLLVVTTFVSTRVLIGKIAEAKEEKEAVARDLLRSSRLASIGELATGLAHEINNPLAIIGAEGTNISDLFRHSDALEPHDHQEIIESLTRIKKQVERAGAITAKMLQFGRHSTSRAEHTDISPLLRETVALLRRQATLRNVELTLKIEPTLPLLVIDGTELQQVLVNLINNSLQALRQGGTVEIDARRVDSEVEILVQDDGPGIPKSELERVFQPFFTTKPVGKGTGLGLSVCYGLVQSWGGSIVAMSEEGLGTTMRIRIPIAQKGGSEHRKGS